MGKMVGIDLGTTNSVVAIVDGPAPRILDNREAKPQTRSAVSLKRKRGKKGDEPDEILVGDAAVDNWPMAPEDTIVSVKRLMGRAVADTEVQRVREWANYKVVQPSDGTKDSVRVVMGGKQYSPTDISAMILRKLKEDAEFRLGEPVTHAVITVPAYFSQSQRDATRKAGLKAGLKVMKILDEPTAAAIAFGVDTGKTTEPKTILVYDLGGGTFDISVLMWAGNVFAPLNKEGDMWLGGDNFDQELVDYAVRHVKQEYGIDPTTDKPIHQRFMAQLRKACQAAKERLSSANSAYIIVAGILQDDQGNAIDLDLEITREEYERMAAPLVARTVNITMKALQNSGYTPEQIDCVLMAGNCTCVPMVQQAVEKIFGPDKVQRKLHPKHAVAMGAALLAARLKKLVCDDPECGHLNELEAEKCTRCGRPLGIIPEPPKPPLPRPDETPSEFTGPVPVFEIPSEDLPEPPVGIAPFHYGTQTAGDKFNVFIKKSDPYPTQKPETQTFVTTMPNQRIISIPVYGGDHVEKASVNEKQGEAFAILPRGLPQGTVVRIKLWLDSDGVFDISAHLEDGTDLKPWIMKGEADAKAIEAMEKAEQVIAQKGERIAPQEREELEEARSRVLERMRNRDFEGALRDAENLGEMADQAGRDKDALRTKAENLIGFTEFVLHQYGWGLDPNQAYQLNNLVEDTKRALERGNVAQLEQKVEALDKATDNLPEVVRVFLALRGAIASRILPVDPSLAASLNSELEELESTVKSGSPAARAKFENFAKRVAEAMKQAEGMPQVGRITCRECGAEVPPGGRHCPNGHDTWLLGSRATTTTGRPGR